MTIVEITGGMLRAARSLAGLSREDLAERAEPAAILVRRVPIAREIAKPTGERQSTLFALP
jgi:ribosome-binding protein aMBF1 (putative translation factor)